MWVWLFGFVLGGFFALGVFSQWVGSFWGFLFGLGFLLLLVLGLCFNVCGFILMGFGGVVVVVFQRVDVLLAAVCCLGNWYGQAVGSAS